MTEIKLHHDLVQRFEENVKASKCSSHIVVDRYSYVLNFNQTSSSKHNGVGYARVSTLKQGAHGHSLLTQTETLIKFCNKHDINLIAICVDANASGVISNLERPAFKHLWTIVNENYVVLVSYFDRLSRSTEDFDQLKWALDRAKIKLQIVEYSLALDPELCRMNREEGVDYTPTFEKQTNLESKSYILEYKSKPNLLTAYGYVRDHSMPYGLPEIYYLIQIDAILQRCADVGYHLTKIFVDREQPGHSLRRPGLLKLFETIEPENVLLVTDTSVLSTEGSDSRKIYSDLKTNKNLVEFLSLRPGDPGFDTRGISNNAAHSINMLMQCGMHDVYKERIVATIRRSGRPLPAAPPLPLGADNPEITTDKDLLIYQQQQQIKRLEETIILILGEDEKSERLIELRKKFERPPLKKSDVLFKGSKKITCGLIRVDSRPTEIKEVKSSTILSLPLSQSSPPLPSQHFGPAPALPGPISPAPLLQPLLFPRSYKSYSSSLLAPLPSQSKPILSPAPPFIPRR